MPALAPEPEIVADEVEDCHFPMAAIVGMQRGGGRGWQLAEQVTGERTTVVEIEVGMVVQVVGLPALRSAWEEYGEWDEEYTWQAGITATVVEVDYQDADVKLATGSVAQQGRRLDIERNKQVERPPPHP